MVKKVKTTKQDLLYMPHCPDPRPCPKTVQLADELVVTYSKPDVELRIKGIKYE